MATHRNREEAVNTQLAILISRYGITADGETIQVHGKHRPDVLFQLRGLRIVIEGKFADHPNALGVVLNDARNRVTAGIAHIAAAAVYPLPLRTTPTTKIIDVLECAKLRFRIVSETHETEEFEGTPRELMDALRRAQESSGARRHRRADGQIVVASTGRHRYAWSGLPGPCDRLSVILKMGTPKGETTERTQERRETASRVAALVLANAYIFQEQLANTDTRVDTFRKPEKTEDIVSATAEHWRWIWETSTTCRFSSSASAC